MPIWFSTTIWYALLRLLVLNRHYICIPPSQDHLPLAMTTWTPTSTTPPVCMTSVRPVILVSVTAWCNMPRPARTREAIQATGGVWCQNVVSLIPMKSSYEVNPLTVWFWYVFSLEPSLRYLGDCDQLPKDTVWNVSAMGINMQEFLFINGVCSIHRTIRPPPPRQKLHQWYLL